MEGVHINYPEQKAELYHLLEGQVKAMVEYSPHLISNLANISAALGSALKNINWVGFYLIPKHFPAYFDLDKIQGKEELLIVGPFQGLPACVEIQIGKGVCGTAVAQNSVMLVPNVHEFPGHIACDCASNSEIVLPLHNANGDVVGVLDIDSPLLERFDEDDKLGLLKVVSIIETMLN
ncbi:MAG: GAF domain-containing protein [Agathobacter sp.]|nr:GAF domain-containing protein [Agathobacter sp.]